jgi:hypothetical protein
MKAIDIKKIRRKLSVIIYALYPEEGKMLLKDYGFTKTGSLQKEKSIPDKDLVECDLFDTLIASAPVVQEQKPNIHYTVHWGFVDYTINLPDGSSADGQFICSKNTVEIEDHIAWYALKNGQVGILKEVADIEKNLEAFSSLNAEKDIKNNREKLMLATNKYNDALFNFLQVVYGNTERLKSLLINNSLAPLPNFFDKRAVRVASHVPNKEGAYLRSQVSHDYNAADPDGVEIKLMNNIDFNEKRPPKGEVFVTCTNDSQVYVKYLKDQEKILIDDANELSRLKNENVLCPTEETVILELIRSQHKQDFTLKRQLNKFGKRIVQCIAKEGNAYNLGANQTRISDMIEYYGASNPAPTANKRWINTLKDKILDHKNKVVRELIHLLQNKEFSNLHVEVAQLKALYPCLLVTYKRINTESSIKTYSDEFIEAYTEFVTHLMISQVNLQLKKKNLYPLLDRRQSFGFLTPTMTGVHTGVRLSMGLTPNDEWIHAVAKGIEQTDHILAQFIFKDVKDKKYNKNNNIFKPNVDTLLNKFRGGEFCGDGHKFFYSYCKEHEGETILKEKLDEQLDKAKINNGELVFRHQKVDPILEAQEYNEIHNRMKKGLVHRYYHYNEEKKQVVCYVGKEMNIESIRPVDPNKLNYFLFKNFSSPDQIRLTNLQESWLNEAIDEPQDTSSVLPSQEFISLYQEIMELYDQMMEIQAHPLIGTSIDLEQITRDLIVTQDKIVEYLFDQRPLITEDTSDEDEHDGSFSKNYYSPAGMSALFAPLYAASTLWATPEIPFPYDIGECAYFELTLSWHKTLDKKYFTRSSLIERDLNKPIFKALRANNIEVNQDTKDFYSELIWLFFDRKCDNRKVIKNSFLVWVNKINTKGIKEDFDKVYDIIEQVFPAYFNKEWFNAVRRPEVYYIDNNPCANEYNKAPRTAFELMDELFFYTDHRPRVLVLDTTSSTQQQIKEFLNEFNAQNRIPILVTASSMVKHSEVGLDLWQGGENKVYLSASMNNDPRLIKMFKEFSCELKKITQSTEGGFARLARRHTRDACNKIHSDKYINEKQKRIEEFKTLTQSVGAFFQQPNELPPKRPIGLGLNTIGFSNT